MSESPSFRAFISALRLGESSALCQFEGEFGPGLRRLVARQFRCRPLLATLYGAEDVANRTLEILARKLARGMLRVDCPADLAKLLATMAKALIKDLTRHHRAEIGAREASQVARFAMGRAEAVRPPASACEDAEFLELVRANVNVKEYELLWARANGESWGVIAAGLGITPNAVRMKYARLLARVRRLFPGPREVF